MRLLVLGGTRFLGRHIVEAALARDHEVTLLTRGQTGADLYPEAERLHADRTRDLSPLLARTWDGVIDTSGYEPEVVAASARALAPFVGTYAFVSSISAYADPSAPSLGEDAPLAPLAPDGVYPDPGVRYGALKAACEREVEAALPGRALRVRPGLIVGPYDPTDRFTWWVRRIAAGGGVLAPLPAQQPAQLIDARDLAGWLVDGVERELAGVFNATGPAEPLTLGALLDAIVATVGGAGARLEWIDEGSLLAAGVEPWQELPLWLALGADPGHRGFLAAEVGRAVAAGLRHRALADTIRDTLAWAEAAGACRLDAPAAGLSTAREAEVRDLLADAAAERRSGTAP